MQPFCRECSTAKVRQARGVDPVASHLRPSPAERCFICGGAGGKKGLFLDHDHLDGHMRGWLCIRCNSGLASFRENPELLERAARYLRMDEDARVIFGALTTTNGENGGA